MWILRDMNVELSFNVIHTHNSYGMNELRCVVSLILLAIIH